MGLETEEEEHADDQSSPVLWKQLNSSFQPKHTISNKRERVEEILYITY